MGGRWAGSRALLCPHVSMPHSAGAVQAGASQSTALEEAGLTLKSQALALPRKKDKVYWYRVGEKGKSKTARWKTHLHTKADILPPAPKPPTVPLAPLSHLTSYSHFFTSRRAISSFSFHQQSLTTEKHWRNSDGERGLFRNTFTFWWQPAWPRTLTAGRMRRIKMTPTGTVTRSYTGS